MGAGLSADGLNPTARTGRPTPRPLNDPNLKLKLAKIKEDEKKMANIVSQKYKMPVVAKVRSQCSHCQCDTESECEAEAEAESDTEVTIPEACDDCDACKALF